MIARTFAFPVIGTPKQVPSYDDLCDDIETMIRETLPVWHDTATRTFVLAEAGERELTFHLYTFLDQTARELCVSWKFAHEHPKPGSRSEDISLVPSVRDGMWIEQSFCAGHERFYTLEAKRLPTPKDSKKDRTREYVCGDWDRACDHKKPCSGGIERFKENKHGEGLTRSGMIAFVQEGTYSAWFVQVNEWIDDIVKHPLPSARSSWSTHDFLDTATECSRCHSEYVSKHARSSNSPSIQLRHFWVACQAVVITSP